MSTYNTWVPVFSSIIYSSLWDEPYHVRLLFMTMLAIKDKDHVVRRTVYALKKAANITEEEVEEALKILAAPDRRRSENQEFEGRRIAKVEEGWLILNGDKYRKLLQTAKRREQKRRYEAKRRALAKKAKGTLLPGEAAYLKALEEGNEAEAERLLNNQPGLDRALDLEGKEIQ